MTGLIREGVAPEFHEKGQSRGARSAVRAGAEPQACAPALAGLAFGRVTAVQGAEGSEGLGVRVTRSRPHGLGTGCGVWVSERICAEAAPRPRPPAGTRGAPGAGPDPTRVLWAPECLLGARRGAGGCGKATELTHGRTIEWTHFKRSVWGLLPSVYTHVPWLGGLPRPHGLPWPQQPPTVAPASAAETDAATDTRLFLSPTLRADTGDLARFSKFERSHGEHA